MTKYSNFKQVNMDGRGGKEAELESVFSSSKGWTRASKKLYDFENTITKERVEVKKQKDLQWLDPTKYNDLSDEEKDIDILFVVIDKTGSVDFSYRIKTEKLVDTLWTDDIMEQSKRLKQICSVIQTKYPIKTRKFYEENKEFCMKLYDKSSTYNAGDMVVDSASLELVKIVSVDTTQAPTVYTVEDLMYGHEYFLSEDDIMENNNV